MQPLSSVGDYRFILPAPELRRYFSSYYFVEIATPGGVELDDLLYPEWASARFMLEGMIPASLVPDPVVPVPKGIDDRAHRARLPCAALLHGWQASACYRRDGTVL